MSPMKRLVSTLALIALVVPMAVPAVAEARSSDTDLRPTNESPAPVPDRCDLRPSLPECQAAPVDRCAIAPERCQPQDPPADRCEVYPDDPRCAVRERPPADRCQENPDHPRCQEPVDRCHPDADNRGRCLDRPTFYRQLFWRIINAGDWQKLIRLLRHLGLI